MLFLQISKEKGVITSLKYNFVFLYYRKLQKSLGSVGSNRPLNLNGVVTRRNKQTNKNETFRETPNQNAPLSHF